MAVYVDELIAYQHQANSAQGRRYFGEGKRSCHLTADSEAELLAFAVDKLKMREEWMQSKGKATVHFDLTPAKRALAVKHGAIESNGRDLARKRIAELRDRVARGGKLVL